MWDYQIKGFMKDVCKMLHDVKDSESSKIKAYKKVIDGKIFVNPRMIRLDMHGGKMGVCQRPLRAQTPPGRTGSACIVRNRARWNNNGGYIFYA